MRRAYRLPGTYFRLLGCALWTAAVVGSGTEKKVDRLRSSKKASKVGASTMIVRGNRSAPSAWNRPQRTPLHGHPSSGSLSHRLSRVHDLKQESLADRKPTGCSVPLESRRDCLRLHRAGVGLFFPATLPASELPRKFLTVRAGARRNDRFGQRQRTTAVVHPPNRIPIKMQRSIISFQDRRVLNLLPLVSKGHHAPVPPRLTGFPRHRHDAHQQTGDQEASNHRPFPHPKNKCLEPL